MVAVRIWVKSSSTTTMLTKCDFFIHRLIGDDHHVKYVVSERVPAVGISSVIYEVVVDVFVAETRRESQRILAVVGVPCNT